MKLQTLPATATTTAVLAALKADGAVVVEDLLAGAAIDTICREIAPFTERAPRGRDEFTGFDTQRTGALVARSPQAREVVMDATALGAARAFLAPFTEKILLHLTQTICIHPGQGHQHLHRDRLAWGTHLPLSIEPQFNTMWALSDFTADNGATRVVPGSHAWDWERRAQPEEFCQAEMARGSVLFYTGSVLHSGGENRSNAARLGLNITYCLGWLRQEENQYLSCPPAIARELAPELQELLGYTQGNYALGYYSDPNTTYEESDLLPPEMALGRKPRTGEGFSLSDDNNDAVTTEFLQALTRQEA